MHAFRLLSLLMGLACGAALASAAWSQSYPAKPVRLVIPYPPGGGTDIVGRALAQKLAEQLGQQVVVDNRPGANGNLGMDFVAKSAPDGYTIVYALFAQYAVNPSLYPNLTYDPVRDFTPITLLARSPYVLFTHPSLPVRTVKDLIALARARPNELIFASAGQGSGAHLSAEMLKSLAKVTYVHVPYKGAGPLLVDLVGGHTQMSFTTWSSGGPHAERGKLRALGVTTGKRSPAIPDIPAISESVPGYDLAVWYGISAPAGLPADIVARLNGEILKALGAGEFRQRIVREAIEPIGSTPEQFGAYIKSESAKWSRLIKAAGIKLE